ncbi:hypothetical protein C8A05DRAFT_45681 [Staphylotrichum tortipilum]|uniref:Uncharacterized protein n=1 Tax=Staphylotrichum tortipilum TaxID=2831512 RepID=A0AAN6MH56_9PEZI|nr:hypothetical protein C8A05DRAFT_45681 [Staphylotrichum longicolle]
MHPPTSILTLALATLTTATPPLQPWQVFRLSTFSPSGRPGSSIWSVINTTILDPNDATVSPAICVGKWTYDALPYGAVNNCSDVTGGRWSFAMLKSDGTGASPTTDFKLRFELVKGGVVFAGTQKFVVGENMSGLCGASGVCSFGLKEEMTPVLVYQAREG